MLQETADERLGRQIAEADLLAAGVVIREGYLSNDQLVDVAVDVAVGVGVNVGVDVGVGTGMQDAIAKPNPPIITKATKPLGSPTLQCFRL